MFGFSFRSCVAFRVWGVCGCLGRVMHKCSVYTPCQHMESNKGSAKVNKR